jgi:hypothetical protein
MNRLLAPSGLLRCNLPQATSLAAESSRNEMESGFLSRIEIAATLARGGTQDPQAQIEVNIPTNGESRDCEESASSNNWLLHQTIYVI